MKILNIFKIVLACFFGLPFVAIAQSNLQVSKSLTLPPFEREREARDAFVMKRFEQEIKPQRESSDLFEGLNQDQRARYENTSKSIRQMVRVASGGVAGGGGNEKEGDFVSLARILNRHLAKDKIKTSQAFGFDIGEYQEAIDTTEVHCAADPNVLMLMRELKKVALFTTQPFRIQLDCENYENAKKNGDIGPIAIFHEYMRSIGRDTSAYEASSKLLLVFYNVIEAKNGLSLLLNEHQDSNKYTCETQEQTETIAKMEPCFRAGSGSDPISSASFNGMAATFRQLEFYKCLSNAYKTTKVDESMTIFWSDIYFLTSEYFKYDLTADRGNQKQRCGLADTFNKYVKLGEPR